MKKKYMMIVIFILLVTLINPGYAMAASGLSDAEQAILDKLRAGAVIDGEMSYLPIGYINQVENELLSNEVDLTKEQADMLVKKIDEAIEIMSTIGYVDSNTIPTSEAAFKLLTVATEAANVLDYEVSVDIVNSSIELKNSDGDTVFISKNMVNQTGKSDSALLVKGGWVLVNLIVILAFIALYYSTDQGMTYEG